MSGQKGRDLLLKIGNGASPEVFTTLGAARTLALSVNNNPVDITALNSNGLQELQADGGVQNLTLNLEGLFKDAAAEEALRLAAFNRSSKNYQLIFPNGHILSGAFIVSSYHREGSYDGLETFTAVLQRSGMSTYI